MFDNLRSTPKQSQTILIILWISFLLAIFATGVFFSLVDPVILSESIQFMNHSSEVIYSVGFFLFWLLSFVSGYCAHLFTKTHNS